MKMSRYVILWAVCAALACSVSGCANSPAVVAGEKVEGEAAQEGQESPAAQESAETVEKAEVPDITGLPLRDKDLLYAQDDDTSVVTMYLTVRRGNTSEGTNHSWQEINSYSAYDYDDMGVPRYQVEGLLQVGDENGPVAGELGYGEKTPNSTIQIRGQTSSRNSQKNYKIRLKDNKGLWRGQQTIALNKHQTDYMRFRNKLAYDLIKGIPQMMGLRTQFVHLYVKDETSGTEGKFEDYGLYTQVEQLNKKALRAHGMDPSGHLYKINFCEFYRYEDVIMPVDAPGYDEKAFNTILECKGDQDHTKLVRLLEDVNDYSIPTEELLAKHFNMENLTYWMAFHILMGNDDTQNRNFYIYSPKNSETWYIISWDNDVCLKRTERKLQGNYYLPGWECGISNYWGNILFRRCLMCKEYREQLDKAVEDLRGYLTEERISGMIANYRTVTEAYCWRMPDQKQQSFTPEEYDYVAKTMTSELEDNYQMYKRSYETPQPFYIDLPQIQNGKLKVQWDVAYDFQAEDITYTAEVAPNYDMKDPIAVYEGVWPEMEFDMLPPGQYFLRVIAKDSSGNEQYAFDYYSTKRGKEFGIRCFYVLPDGTIGEDIYEE